MYKSECGGGRGGGRDDMIIEEIVWFRCSLCNYLEIRQQAR